MLGYRNQGDNNQNSERREKKMWVGSLFINSYEEAWANKILLPLHQSFRLVGNSPTNSGNLTDTFLITIWKQGI